MRWKIHGERSVYDSEWVRLTLVDLELPDGHRFEHHVVRAPSDAAGTLVLDPERGVLLLWRHRFITDTAGWEFPAGAVDEGETPRAAAAREVLEETGWRPGPLEPLCEFDPIHGLVDQRFHCFVAHGAEHVGPPTDPHESERIEWVPVAELAGMLRRGEIDDGPTVTALLWALQLGPLAAASGADPAGAAT